FLAHYLFTCFPALQDPHTFPTRRSSDLNGVAVRSSQNNISDNLLPSKNLLLQTKLVDQVASMRPNIYVGKVDNSAMYRKWYFEVDRKSTRLNSSHVSISYAVFCLKTTN